MAIVVWMNGGILEIGYNRLVIGPMAIELVNVSLLKHWPGLLGEGGGAFFMIGLLFLYISNGGINWLHSLMRRSLV